MFILRSLISVQVSKKNIWLVTSDVVPVWSIFTTTDVPRQYSFSAIVKAPLPRIKNMIFCKIVNLEYVPFYLRGRITTFRITILVKTNSLKGIITPRIKIKLLLSKLLLLYWHLKSPNMHDIFLPHYCMKSVPRYSQKKIPN